MALAYDLSFISGKFVHLVAQKSLHSFPIPPFVPKTRKTKDPISISITLAPITLVLPFLFILMLHEDQFFGFVLVTRWIHIPKIYIEECCCSSRPETFCLYALSSLRTDLWWWVLGWMSHWFYLDLLADFAEQKCEKVLDAVMSLCNKIRLLTRQGVADCESISTRAMAWQVR